MQHRTILLLVVFLGSHLIFPLMSRRWYLSLPAHDHIILGVIHPGWENHSHGEPDQQSHSSFSKNYAHTHSELSPHHHHQSPASSKIISIYHSPTGDGDSVVSAGSQSILLFNWSPTPDLRQFTWPLSSPQLSNTGVLLPPPDRPPVIPAHFS